MQKSNELTERQRVLGEFYRWLQLRADHLREQRRKAGESAKAEQQPEAIPTEPKTE